MKASRKTSALRRCILETLESRQLMAAGVLDNSFSDNGKQTVEFGPGQKLFAADVAVQADGKTVIAGNLVPDNLHFAVARLNFDGTPDLTFGHNGIALQFFDGRTFTKASSVAIQSDGKIVVAGSLDFNKWAVARFLPNGQPDTSFDSDGKQTIGFDGDLNDILIQSDGKIVLIGYNNDKGFLSLGHNLNFAVARLNPNGRLDGTFNGDGKKQVGFGDSETANAGAIDSRGRIVLVGDKILSDGNNFAFAVTRVNSNGTTDTSFGNGGTIVTSFPGHPSATPEGVMIQPSGKIVVAGRSNDNSTSTFALARYLPSGRLDTTFGLAGTGLLEFPISGGRDVAFDLISGADGGIVVAGTANGKFALAGLTTDGRPDSSFGNAGTVVTDFGGINGAIGNMGIAKGPGRRFVVAGGSHFKVARYLDEGANVVSISALGNPSISLVAAETAPGSAPDIAQFIVQRSEKLPVATRVFLSVFGSAQKPEFLSGGDYTVDRIQNFTGVRTTTTTTTGGGTTSSTPIPFVDIPANATSVEVRLTAVDDSRLEPVETASFAIRTTPNTSYEIAAQRSVTVFIGDNEQARINFQAQGSVPAGHVADIGQVFGSRNGLSYGWDADNTANTRIRNNSGSPDLRYDTLNHLQKPGGGSTWEIALPNGIYEVHLVAGDASNTDSVYKLNLENVLSLEGTPSGNTRWFERTMWIQVNDGRLTLSNAAGAINNKIAYVDIKAAPVGVSGVSRPVTDNIPVTLGSAAPTPLTQPPPFSNRLIEGLPSLR